jgi:hypothetical protein
MSSADTGPSPPSPTDNHGLRQAWTSLRERLGLHGIVPGSSTNNTSGPNARETMFAEMARAFDIGSVLSSGDDSQERAGNARSASFERFLADLQSDLRRLLHWGESDSHGSGADAVASTGSTSSRTSLESTTSPSHHTPQTSISSNNSQDRPHVRDDDIRSLSESESESGEEGVTSPNRRDDSSASAADSMPLQDVNGEVNWWRVYSFPQVPISNGLSETADSQRPEASGPGAIHVSNAPSVSTNTSAMDTHETPASPLPAEPQPQLFPIPPSFLIPVIIVGFRAINPESQEGGQRAAATVAPRTTTPETLYESTTSDIDAGTNSGSTLDLPIADESDGSPTSHVTRSYRSNPQMSPPPAEPNNNDNTPISRTFLIYVIGGTYLFFIWLKRKEILISWRIFL